MTDEVFSFRNVTYEEVLNKIQNLDTSKSTYSEGIPFNIIEDDANIFANLFLQTNSSEAESFVTN